MSCAKISHGLTCSNCDQTLVTWCINGWYLMVEYCNANSKVSPNICMMHYEMFDWEILVPPVAFVWKEKCTLLKTYYYCYCCLLAIVIIEVIILYNEGRDVIFASNKNQLHSCQCCHYIHAFYYWEIRIEESTVEYYVCQQIKDWYNFLESE